MRRRLRTFAAAAALMLSSGVAMAKEATAVIKVSGWHCGGCSAATEASVKKIGGVESAKADLGTGTLKIVYDDAKTNVGELEKAVEKAGYKVVHQ